MAQDGGKVVEIPMHSVGFEPAIPAVERLQTYALDYTAAGIGNNDI